MKDTAATGFEKIVEDAESFWRDFAKTILQGSLLAIEESAKQVIGVNGVLIGFYTIAIALSEMRNNHLQIGQLALYVSPIILWLISLALALSIFWSRELDLTLQSWRGAKDTIDKLLERKHRRLRASFIFLFAGIILLTISLVGYLIGI